ncbi:unnamed protein product, partial [Mesorhabditis spiculigera]
MSCNTQLQTQIRYDWDSRADEQIISQKVKHIAACLAEFETSCRNKLAALSDKICLLEKKVEFLEARVSRGDTLC